MFDIFENMPWAKRKQIENKFNINIEDLIVIGEGSYGTAFQIDNKSVLKVTPAVAEINALSFLIHKGLNLKPGIATVLEDDILETKYKYYERLFFYRTELLMPAEKAFDWASQRDLLELHDEIDIRASITRLYSITLDIIPSDYSKAIIDQGILDVPMLVPIALALKPAFDLGVRIWDTKTDNMGFRLDEKGNPALDAGLVFFDPLMGTW